MSREQSRKPYFPRDPRDPRERRDPRDRDRDRDRIDYRTFDKRRLGSIKGRSPLRGDGDHRRSRSPRKPDKDGLDEKLLSEIAKLPEPSELWDNQFQDSNSFPPPLPPPGFNPESVRGTTSFPPSYSASYSGVYDDFPSSMVSAPQMPLQPPEWNQLSLPPAPSSAFIPNIEDQMKKEAAIESEMRHQKAALSKQREDYIKKSSILKKELDTLKDQRNELRGDAKRSPSPDTKRFLKENTKLQLEIQNKLKTINNVVDMLNGIIGEEAHQDVVESDDDAGSTKRKSRSPSNKKSNYVYYDPEMHWCRVCNEFPPTAKDYLNHLHSPAHHKMAAQHMEAPWHSVTGVNEGFPSYPSAPTKRTPIRGLQFFVPSTAWYCKLCDQFIGDLHCASAHLKSIVHSKNYSNFVEQNPHWETDWMSDRQKALEKTRGKAAVKAEEKTQQYAPHTITFHKDGFHTKTRKDSPPPPEEKKVKKEKKKRKKSKKSSSSDSSDSSSSDSEPAKKKKRKKDKDKKRAPSESDEKALSTWMSSVNANRLSSHDRQLLDTLKTKIKQERQDEDERERERNAEAHRKLREMERERRGERRVEPQRRARSREQDTRGNDRARDNNDRSRDNNDRSRDNNDRVRDRDKRTEKTEETRDQKKPEIKKMPFIGKMPIYKGITKAKTEDQKKEEEKKKEDDDAAKKRREEMDAEIQKKVAEFKEKIAKAQLEREQSAAAAALPAVPLALPTELGGLLPPPIYAPPPPQPQPQLQPQPQMQPQLQQLQPQPQPPSVPPPPPPAVPALPKDFQDALDIIFPTDAKKAELASQDLFSGMPHVPGYTGILGPFPSLLPQMNPFMNPFDINATLFPPRPQLYEAHVPISVPNQNKRQNNNSTNKNKFQNKKPYNQKQNYQNNQNQNQNKQNQNRNLKNQNEERPQQSKEAVTPKSQIDAQAEKEKNGPVDMKREELDDLAMLGIDASDVGAGI